MDQNEQNPNPTFPHMENDPTTFENSDIIGEMQRAYIDYSMSVIVDRALPDVRDGLKPVHRRILYAMHGLGLKPEAKFRKSATIVGEVLGKYHPHGDTAVYDALVRMAQYFSMRYTLIKGQGNFGSMDGDKAAAMRYTEAKMDKIAREMLLDIEKDTVDFGPNYDGSQKEPKVLPARIPNLLINGVSGIAVGMATNIPPHNLIEVCDATTHLIDNPDAGVEDLMQFVKGPDFPTGGEMYDMRNIKQVYATGRGPIVTRAKVEIVETKKGRHDIIVTEMTFQTNKATLIEKMANLVRDKKIEGIRDLRDESDKDGVRVVIELKNDAYPQKVLNKLYKLTDLQKTFHTNMLALCEGIEPRTLSLKNVLQYYIDHRKEVIIRKTEYELRAARDRAHILEGLKKALDMIDEVINTIRSSATKTDAFHNLIDKFGFTERQAQAILDMRLQTLAGLERQKIIDELAALMEIIKDLEDILANESRIYAIIKADLEEVKEKYGDERKTGFNKEALQEFSDIDFIPNEETLIIMTKEGYIKRVNPSEYRAQKRGGVGVSGLKTREDDSVLQFLHTTTHTKLLFFTNNGRVLQLKAYEIPESSRIAKGHSIVNFLQLGADENIRTMMHVEDSTEGYIFFATIKGMIKKTDINLFKNIRQGGIIAINLKDGDKLQSVGYGSSGDDVMLFTKCGKAIRFGEDDARAMGRTASGVKGISLKAEDTVVGMSIVPGDAEGWFVVVSEKGYGKRTKLKEYKVQKRGGAGMKISKVTTKTGAIADVRVVGPQSKEVIAISHKGNIIRMKVSQINILGRDTQGVRLMRLSKDTIATIQVWDEDPEDES
jgi:DNA gyrase subunit A